MNTPRIRPIRVRVQGEEGDRERLCRVSGPMRFGYGKDCEVAMAHGEGAAGPDVLFELQRVAGPVRLYLPIAPAELEARAEIVLNGKPLTGESSHEIEPGSRLEVVDKATRRRYRLLVEPRPFVLFRPRVLAAALALLALAVAAYGGYLYQRLVAARTEIASTSEALSRTRSAVERSERALLERIARLESSAQRLVAATAEIQRLHEESAREIRAAFDARLDALGEGARAALEQVSERDSAERARLAARTRADIEALRGEFSGRMVEAYLRLKQTEARLFEAVAAGREAARPVSERLKEVFAAARPAVVFVRTRYVVRVTESGETSEVESFGSGFLVSGDGLALTAQHVLFPWRHDREFVVLRALGLVELDAGSVRWSAWTVGETVRTPGESGADGEPVGGHHSDSPEPRLRFVYAPEASRAEELVATPMGIVSVRLPQSGPTDVAAFQIAGLDRPFPALALAPHETASSEPLDEVLAVGYPFSRLDEGVANPQAVHGYVRRVGREALELDTALHPGLSGGPILDREGRVVAMAMAQFHSEVYGMAARARDLAAAIAAARDAIRADEARLESIGCAPGPVDGRVDAATWVAWACERRRAESAGSGS